MEAKDTKVEDAIVIVEWLSELEGSVWLVSGMRIVGCLLIAVGYPVGFGSKPVNPKRAYADHCGTKPTPNPWKSVAWNQGEKTSIQTCEFEEEKQDKQKVKIFICTKNWKGQ